MMPAAVSSLNLITGALPAEYGLRTAGIIDITTKSGCSTPGGRWQSMAAAIAPSSRAPTYGGGDGNFSYFVTGDFLAQ